MDDLLKLKDAAQLVGKSTATIRRYIRDGRLDRHEGVQDGSGGSPPVLVSQSQLLSLIGSTLSLQGDHEKKDRDVQASKEERVQDAFEHLLRIATLEGQVNTLTAQLEASERALMTEKDSNSALVRELQQSLYEAREDAKDWKGRADAKDAELKALNGRSWFARLLTGPTRL